MHAQIEDVLATGSGPAHPVDGEIKKWHGSPTSFLGYLISHEAHHRGLLLVSLRLSGHKVPQEVIYGIWDWGKLSSWRARKRTTPKATKK